MLVFQTFNRPEMTEALKTRSTPHHSINGKGRTARAPPEWHYSVSDLTWRSSSSGDDASSEESPQPHESSESESQGSILGRKVSPQAPARNLRPSSANLRKTGVAVRPALVVHAERRRGGSRFFGNGSTMVTGWDETPNHTEFSRQEVKPSWKRFCSPELVPILLKAPSVARTLGI